MTIRNLSIPILTMATLLSTPFSAMAQNEKETPTTQDQPGNRETKSSETDSILASWIAIENDNELALATLAEQRTQNAHVREFAQMMLKDHSAFGQQLKQVTGSAAQGSRTKDGRPATGNDRDSGKHPDDASGTGRGRPVDPSGNNTGDGTTGSTTGRSGRDNDDARNPGSQQLDHMALLRELGNKCRESANQELSSKQGAEFDRCYIGMQIGAHMMVLDQLQVFAKHASPQLRSTFEQAAKTVSSHLEKAKSISKQLDGTARDQKSGQNG